MCTQVGDLLSFHCWCDTFLALHHRANTPGEPMTPVHLQLIRTTLSKLSVPWKERADQRQATLIELMGGGALGRRWGDLGKWRWVNCALNWGQRRGGAVFFNGGCQLKKLWCMVRLEQRCVLVWHNMSNMCSEMDLGRHLCEGWMNEWLHSSFSSRVSVQKDEWPGT